MAVSEEVAVAICDADVGRGRTRLVGLSVAAGVLLTVFWSYTFVDSVIGDNVATVLLGYDAKEGTITNSLMGASFAFVSGLAGTFTACNVAAFSALGPLIGGAPSREGIFARTLRPAGWLALGSCAVACSYGAIGAMVGDDLPQLSDELIGNGMPVRLLQSVFVFGVIGAVLVYLGLAALRIVPDPLARISRRHPNAPLVIMGGLIGAFLVGRPFPLFFKLFQYAASTHDPLIGAATFGLQAVGNIAVVVVLFWAVHLLLGARLRHSDDLRLKVSKLGAAGLLVAGSFTFLYWVVRVPALFGYGWWIQPPWQ
jgi:hypothetical protein